MHIWPMLRLSIGYRHIEIVLPSIQAILLPICRRHRDGGLGEHAVWNGTHVYRWSCHHRVIRTQFEGRYLLKLSSYFTVTQVSNWMTPVFMNCLAQLIISTLQRSPVDSVVHVQLPVALIQFSLSLLFKSNARFCKLFGFMLPTSFLNISKFFIIISLHNYCENCRLCQYMRYSFRPSLKLVE